MQTQNRYHTNSTAEYTDPIQKLQYDPISLQDIKPDLPESLTRTIMKALARNPDERYQTAGEMAKALEDWRLEA